MAKRMERFQDDKGPSARHLVLMFLAAVAICAVFFSLGFVVGYNHSPSSVTPVTENVQPSGNIPPTVNAPLGASSQSSSQGVESENVNPNSNAIPPRVSPVPSQPAPVTVAKPKPHREAPQKPARKPVPVRKPAVVKQKHPEPVHPASSAPHYVVQVMASRTRQDAARLVRLLASHNFHVFILTPQESHASDHLYRVQVGPFASQASAKRAVHRLEGEGFRPFITH